MNDVFIIILFAVVIGVIAVKMYKSGKKDDGKGSSKPTYQPRPDNEQEENPTK